MSACRYLLSRAGVEALSSFLQKRPLLGFDFDGTLAGIVRRPAAAGMTSRTRRSLRSLLRLVPVAVISGRCLSDLKNRLSLPVCWMAGNHGAEGTGINPETGQSMFRTCRRWLTRFAALGYTSCAGIEAEDKGYSIALHYRNAPGDRARLGRRLLREARRLRPRARIITGKFVVNLVPARAPDKGAALLEFVRRSGASAAFYIGDDDTDEDVFRLARSARFRARVFSVRVGRAAKTRKTSASWHLRSQSEVDRLLEIMDSILRKIS